MTTTTRIAKEQFDALNCTLVTPNALRVPVGDPTPHNDFYLSADGLTNVNVFTINGVTHYLAQARDQP